MKKITLLLILFFAISSIEFKASAQTPSATETVFNAINNCKCGEIFIVSGGKQNWYSIDWLDDVKIDGKFIVFQRKEKKHYWNLESVVNFEFGKNAQGENIIKIYLDDKAK